uniref:Uncharacterized protein n=1 Tax=Opuntia streptacantha TaxID=393608 RepID=A0A7C9E9S4_OPUST
MNPLPTIEIICVMLQQEELQKQVLEEMKISSEISVMMRKNSDGMGHITCTECRNRVHSRGDKCWQIIGYPTWHPKSKKQNSQKSRRQGMRNQRNFRSRSDVQN